ncbi:MAG: tRNA adenosine(34) deaminase TadA [Parachlamydiales bacterium]
MVNHLAPETEDERFMLEALKEAKKAYRAGEVPVGAIIVSEGRIIARGHNQVELLRDASAHAEMLTLTVASSALSNWRLTGTTLYSTLEPCAMCLGAMLLARIDRLVWGAPDLRHGANGSWVDLLKEPHPTHTLTVTSGILREPCAMLMQQFFQERRRGSANGAAGRAGRGAAEEGACLGAEDPSQLDL